MEERYPYRAAIDISQERVNVALAEYGEYLVTIDPHTLEQVYGFTTKELRDKFLAAHPRTGRLVE